MELLRPAEEKIKELEHVLGQRTAKIRTRTNRERTQATSQTIEKQVRPHRYRHPARIPGHWSRRKHGDVRGKSQVAEAAHFHNVLGH